MIVYDDCYVIVYVKILCYNLERELISIGLIYESPKVGGIICTSYTI